MPGLMLSDGLPSLLGPEQMCELPEGRCRASGESDMGVFARFVLEPRTSLWQRYERRRRHDKNMWALTGHAPSEPRPEVLLTIRTNGLLTNPALSPVFGDLGPGRQGGNPVWPGPLKVVLVALVRMAYTHAHTRTRLARSGTLHPCRRAPTGPPGNSLMPASSFLGFFFFFLPPPPFFSSSCILHINNKHGIGITHLGSWG
jgi:hypothetical protein